jgi:hypothetical protein
VFELNRDTRCVRFVEVTLYIAHSGAVGLQDRSYPVVKAILTETFTRVQLPVLERGGLSGRLEAEGVSGGDLVTIVLVPLDEASHVVGVRDLCSEGSVWPV